VQFTRLLTIGLTKQNKTNKNDKEHKQINIPLALRAIKRGANYQNS